MQNFSTFPISQLGKYPKKCTFGTFGKIDSEMGTFSGGIARLRDSGLQGPQKYLGPALEIPPKRGHFWFFLVKMCTFWPKIGLKHHFLARFLGSRT